MTWFNAKLFKVMAPLALAAQLASASASVVMPATRVIYAADAHEQTMQFTSQNDSPSVMQIWVDSGNPESTPQTADAPFVVTPPVFRINPKAGQTVRLVFTGKALPQDRESVFYLNTLEIPSINRAYADQNQMLVMLRNRLKVFYRPAGIAGSAQKAPEQLSFHLESEAGTWRIHANNASGYYISLVEGSLVSGSQVANFTPSMIAPHSGQSWKVELARLNDSAAVRVKVKYVDDYGATRDAEYPLTGTTGKN
ncbi:putative fimbrial chaperone YadV [Paraburkholderia caffeinitolerans]|uniref:Putative fimbrial chaperone YadV n=1 Tax=Paraburkholderia caffeinitolerans TaxID=1723730 RepID=A0A6J5H050_9BURK|nr:MULTISPECIES: molecular chaperone [Paraburkholderia]CAB3809325.1 putative fimbrial chaperone YadV [Paraburkholderia caffeinitolerans]